MNRKIIWNYIGISAISVLIGIMIIVCIRSYKEQYEYNQPYGFETGYAYYLTKSGAALTEAQYKFIKYGDETWQPEEWIKDEEIVDLSAQMINSVYLKGAYKEKYGQAYQYELSYIKRNEEIKWGHKLY